MARVTVTLTEVCLLLSVGLSFAAFDPGQLVGQTYQKLQTGGLPFAGSLPSLSPSLLASLSVYRNPKGGKSIVVPSPFNFQPPTIPAADPTIPSPHSPLPDVVCDDPPVQCVEGKYRTADGSCNNLDGHPRWGQAGRPQERLLQPAYQNGRDSPRSRGVRGHSLPSAREVSQALHTGDNPYTESPNITHLFTVWGQFLDHDITHTPIARDTDGSSLDCCNQPQMLERDLYWLPTGTNLNSFQQSRQLSRNANCFPIPMSPDTDRRFRSRCMNFVRSKPFAPSAACRSATREQGNTQSSFIDGSQVYGPSLGDQLNLRSGTAGQLRSSAHDMLPANSSTMCTSSPHEGEFCFGSGDPRVNEHPMLTSVHIVFHRLHNVIASYLSVLNPLWSDETLFQEARKIVGAILQHITYAEYLPLVLGEREMARHNLTLHGAFPYVYDPYVNPNIFNSFSAAAFRFGHSMVNGKNSYGFQKINLREMFFHPHFVQHAKGAGLTMLLNGLIRDHSQSADRLMNRDLTDHLFQSKDGRSLDLASLNIQRGRDHGLPPYDQFRKLCGLPTLQEVAGIKKLEDPFFRVYRDVDDVDLFTGGLSEDPVEGGVVGPTFACLIARQFHRLKFGDRFWYQNTQHRGALYPDQIRTIEKVGMADVLCATTTMTAVPTNPFAEASVGNPVKECSSLPPFDMRAWQQR